MPVKLEDIWDEPEQPPAASPTASTSGAVRLEDIWGEPAPAQKRLQKAVPSVPPEKKPFSFQDPSTWGPNVPPPPADEPAYGLIPEGTPERSAAFAKYREGITGAPNASRQPASRDSLPVRGAKQYANQAILSDIESSRPETNVAESVATIVPIMQQWQASELRGDPRGPALMKSAQNRFYDGGVGDWPGAYADMVKGFAQTWWDLTSGYHGAEGKSRRLQARQAVAQMRKESGSALPSAEFNVPPAETSGENVADVVASVGAFVTRLAIAKRLIPAEVLINAPQPLVTALQWELVNTDGIPGQGAMMSGTLGAIGKIPAKTLLGKGGRLAAESAAFGGTTLAMGGTPEDAVIAALIPVAMAGAHAVSGKIKQKLIGAKTAAARDAAIREYRREALKELGLPKKPTFDQIKSAFRAAAKARAAGTGLSPTEAETAALQDAYAARDFLMGRALVFERQARTAAQKATVDGNNNGVNYTGPTTGEGGAIVARNYFDPKTGRPITVGPGQDLAVEVARARGELSPAQPTPADKQQRAVAELSEAAQAAPEAIQTVEPPSSDVVLQAGADGQVIEQPMMQLAGDLSPDAALDQAKQQAQPPSLDTTISRPAAETEAAPQEVAPEQSPQEVVKQPWEMTAKELNSAVGESAESRRASGIEPWMVTQSQAVEYARLREKKSKTDKVWLGSAGTEKATRTVHKRAVQQALSEGKPVPAEVLAEYPDLSPPAAQPVQAEPVTAEQVEPTEDGLGVQADIPLPAESGSGKAINQGQVVSGFSDLFGVPIRTGRFRGKRLGIFKRGPKVVRTKGYGDIATASHEVAHFLHRHYDPGMIKAAPAEVVAELRGLDYDQNKRRPAEGFAEFVRIKLTLDSAQDVAPKTAEWFENTWLASRPEIATAMSRARGLVDQWRGQGALSMVKAQIDREVGIGPKALEALSRPAATATRLWHKVHDEMLSRRGPLVRAQKRMAKEAWLTRLPAKYRFADAAKVLTMAASSRARQASLEYMPDVMGNEVGPSLKEVLRPVSESLKTTEGLEDFEAFLYARHALDVLAKGKDPGITKEVAQIAHDQLKDRPGWSAAADGVTAWHQQLLDYLVDAGGLSQEADKVMRDTYPHYIPLFRSMEPGRGLSGGAGRKLANVGQPIKRLKGSGRAIIDPLESSIMWAEKLMGTADAIRVGNILVDAAEKYGGMGEIIEEVPPSLVPHSSQITNIAKQLSEAGADLSEADMDAVVTIFANSYRADNKDNIALLVRDGKIRAYQLDPDLHRSMTGMWGPAMLPKILDIALGKPTRGLRLLATGLRAGFSLISNPLRDTATAAMQTQTTGLKSTLPALAVRNAVALADDLLNTQVAQLYKAGGGEMAQPLSLDRRFAREAVQELLAYNWKQTAAEWSKHPVDTLRRAFGVTELAPRIAEFKAVLKEMGWKEGQKITWDQYVAAQMAAADVSVDFREGGHLAMWLNRVSAFYNANVQGKRRMIDSHIKHPVRSVMRGLLWMTLPSLLLWWRHKDDEWYKDLPASEKAKYWHIGIGDSVIRVPKPFEWGQVYGSLFVAVWEGMWQSGDSRWDQAKEQLGELARLLEEMIPIPTAAIPAVEVAANKDFYRDRPIESRSLEQLPPPERYYAGTTRAAKLIGSALGVSPAKLDHLLSGYTAGAATDASRAIETGAGKVGLLPSKGEAPAELSDIPALGRLFLRPGISRAINDFYDAKERVDQAFAMSRRDNTPLDKETAMARYRMSRASKVLSRYRDAVRNTIESRRPERDKRELISGLRDEMQDFARWGVTGGSTSPDTKWLEKAAAANRGTP